jgi:hypothetical protein
MALQEHSDLVGLLIGPTEVIPEVAGNFPEETRSVSVDCCEKLAGILAKLRRDRARAAR